MKIAIMLPSSRMTAWPSVRPDPGLSPFPGLAADQTEEPSNLACS